MYVLTLASLPTVPPVKEPWAGGLKVGGSRQPSMNTTLPVVVEVGAVAYVAVGQSVSSQVSE